MYKELVICIIVVALIIIGNIVTQNSTNKIVQEVAGSLLTLRQEVIKKEEARQEKAQELMENTNKTWKDKYEMMAYYIEHDELEKVETELTKLKADIEVEEYEVAVENLDACIFILEHIKDKSALKIVNLF